MGHLNIRDLLESNQKGTILGMKLGRNSQENFECLKGKMTRSPFPKNSEKSTEVLEIIHSDVWGPARTKSIGGAKFFVTFIDDHSRWCTVKLLKGKNEVLSAFKDFKNFAENQTGKKIKFLQSDNGTEYMNNDFNDFLKNNGIGRRLTVTHTHQNRMGAQRGRIVHWWK